MRLKIRHLFCVIGILPIFLTDVVAQTIVPPWSWSINSDFGPRVLSGTWDYHEGVDYLATAGESINPVEDGTIAGIGFSGGWYISVDGEHGHWAYIHLFSDGTLPRNSRGIRGRC